MSIVPTGNPAWARSNGHTAYGGNVNKVNYQSVGTINPRTDLSAENICRMAADLAAVARVSPFAVITFTCNDTAPAAPTVDHYYAMAGNTPTGTRNGTGDVTFDWENSYTDDYGVSANANIIAATVTVHSSAGIAYYACVQLLSSGGTIYDQVRVRAFDFAGAALSDAKMTLSIWTG
jgi:hypothetical protein